MAKSGILYIVATPIGNMSDITLRALEVLKSVDLIGAEDTRTTGVLLSHYEIKTKTTSYHKFNEAEKAPLLLEKLIQGANIAIVCDAGTPLISDPGNILVKKAQELGVKISPIGGICAVTTFMSSISREGESFKFIGFLPKAPSQIEKIFIENEFENLVFYESPNRILKTLDILQAQRPKAKVSLGRELTKKFEEIKTESVENLIEKFKNTEPKGEFACMVHKSTAQKDEKALQNKIKLLKQNGFSQKDVCAILNITDGANKNSVKEYFLKNN